MIVRSIEAIIRMLDADYIENGNIEEKICGVCIDSRRVEANNLYIPIRGANNNGHLFVKQAIEKGAKAVLWERQEPNPPKDVVVTLKVKLAQLEEDDFTCTLQDSVYDATAKFATVTCDKTGIGTINVKYYLNNQEVTNPTKVGTYTVTVKGPDNEVLHQGDYDYGTMLSEAVAGILPPGKNSGDLGFYYAYQFKGYRIDSNELISSLEDLAKAELRSDRTLTAGYEPTHVYTNPMSADYFDTISNEGYLSLKSNANITLKDKITVPKQVIKNGNPVTVKGLATGCFQYNASAQKYTSGITHIFFEPDEFIDDNHFTPNTQITHLGLYSCSNSPASTTFIELPPNITSVAESGGWTGGSANTIVILNPSMQRIADNLFMKFQGKLCMNTNIGTSGSAITEIDLPNVSYIGKDSFKEAGRLD
jgi:hypothetical protein